jgi:hypothetical protein
MSAVKVNCEAKYPSNGEQIPKLYWSLNGTQLIPQSKYKTHLLEQDKGHYTLITMSLTIYNYSKSECLWYTCVMNTSQGTMERLVAPPCPMNKTDTEGWYLLARPLSTLRGGSRDFRKGDPTDSPFVQTRPLRGEPAKFCVTDFF